MFSIQVLKDSELPYADRQRWEAIMEAIPTLEKWHHVYSRKTVGELQRKLIEWKTKSAEEKCRKPLDDAPNTVQRRLFRTKPLSLSPILKNINVSEIVRPAIS